MVDLPKVRQRLIHLTYCRGINRHFICKLLKEDPQLAQLYSLTSKDLHDLYSLPFKNAKRFLKDLHNERIVTQIKQHLQRFQIMTIFDHDYPPLLKNIYDPPLVLFLAGHRNLLQRDPKLSVIGTRHPSKNAYEKVKFYLGPLIDHHWTIVSGLARGIDSFAHDVTLRAGGITIAILGGGFFHIYPREHYSLFLQIKQHGLVISEYPPHITPKKYHFPERNRLISGLSYGTLVIEAMEQSGTFITVDQALEQGRQVYVAPGCPLTKQTTGCHRLIQEGAHLVVNGEDLLTDWRLIGKTYTLKRSLYS